MTTTEQPPQRTVTAALNAALAAAQGEFGTIPRDKTVDTGGYTFSYAELGTILASVRPILAKHGLAVTQLLEHNGQPCIRTELRHAEGGVLGASFPLPRMPDSPQQLGSLITYLRRYALVSLLAIAPEEDDDGEQASESAKAAPERPWRPDVTMELASDAQTKNIWRLFNKAEKAGIATKDQLREQMGVSNGTENPAELTKQQAIQVITDLKALTGEE